MSSKKIYTTVGMDEIVMTRLQTEAKREQRSKSFIVERALLEHFKLLKREGEKEATYGNEITQA